MKKTFILDTNAYRVITFDRSLEEIREMMARIREHENHAACSSLAHPVVIWELLAHLLDREDLAYTHCLNALVALGEHTKSRQRNDGSIDLIADALSTVCGALFEKLPPGYQQGLQNLGGLVSHITKNAPDLSDPIAQTNIKNLGSGMARREKQWLAGMQEVLERFSPEVAKAVFGSGTDKEALNELRKFLASDTFFEAWSVYVVLSNGREVGITNLGNAELQEKAKFVREVFPVPFKLMQSLLEKLATDKNMNLNSPKRKRWNFVWDSMISFSVGPGTIADSPVYLVTGDGEIAEAAREANVESQVISAQHYLAGIGITDILKSA